MTFTSEKFKDNLRQMDFYDPSVSEGFRSLRFVSEKENNNLKPTEVFTLEKAEIFKADAVYFRYFSDGRAPIPQIYLYDNTNEKWQNGDYSTASSTVITDLKPGSQITFHVRAIGTKGKKSGWSQEVTVWVS